MKLYLVRHGESTANQLGVHHREDEQLTKRGVDESEATATRLRDVKFDLVFVSPLLRARETAATINMWNHGAHVAIDDRLRERAIGVYAGAPHGTLHAAARDAGAIYEEFRAPGGESIRDMEQRVQQFMQDLTTLHAALRTVLIVSHVGPIAAMLRAFTTAIDGSFPSGAVRNASITVLDTDKPGVVTIFADVTHLAGLDKNFSPPGE